MFDNPKQELKWLEDELLAAEAEMDAQWPEDEEPEEEEVYEEPPRRKKRKNPAADYGRTMFEDEGELDESAALLDDRRKAKGIGGLVFLAILETLGIVAVAIWWLKWLI